MRLRTIRAAAGISHGLEQRPLARHRVPAAALVHPGCLVWGAWSGGAASGQSRLQPAQAELLLPGGGERLRDAAPPGPQRSS